MTTKPLPLKQLSINQIYNGENATYEVPIYQRNYAWEKDEIFTLIQDVYDAFTTTNKQPYYIGTLVSYHKGDHVYEVIDGQQRLTTINLVLRALNIVIQNKLTYRAREKSNKTILSFQSSHSTELGIDEKDKGIVCGFAYAKEAIEYIVQLLNQKKIEDFKNYFLNSVYLIHYQVPKDIDLNHYFEIMNSRGEQLEKHEIIKARLIEKLNDKDKAKFNCLWEYCSEMNVYIQQKYRKDASAIFGESLCNFELSAFDGLPMVDNNTGTKTIIDFIKNESESIQKHEKDKIDSFQPIIDFSNFLLIVLKVTRIQDNSFKPTEFILDDKELIHEFDSFQVEESFVKKFGFNLLKAKFLLDNYLVHHSNEDDKITSNPWKLQQYRQKDGQKGLTNLGGDSDEQHKDDQHKLVQLLSMFEVTFTARQRKNYLFYCLLYLFPSKNRNIKNYFEFVSGLADKYFKDVYLKKDKLSKINTPLPGSFDNTILDKDKLNITPVNIDASAKTFTDIYGDGTILSKGIPLFIFNYLDYKLWEKYFDELRGEGTKEERAKFFDMLGCSDFGLDVFKQLYFSRTRGSLEHYYAQALVKKRGDVVNEAHINCLGNYAMIGSEANSSGSDWTPIFKRGRYLDTSRKINPVSVASIKFIIMMQKCKDNEDSKLRQVGLEWNFDDIKEHQEKMLRVLLS